MTFLSRVHLTACDVLNPIDIFWQESYSLSGMSSIVMVGSVLRKQKTKFQKATKRVWEGI